MGVEGCDAEMEENLILAAQEYRDRYKVGLGVPITVKLPDVAYERFLDYDLPERMLVEHNIHIRPDSFYEVVNDED